MRTRAGFPAFCCLLLVPLFANLAAAGVEPTPVREADASCAGCHQKIYESYLTTPMANASGLATEKLRPATFVHSPSGTEYKISVRDQQGELAYRSMKEPNIAGERRLDYFLGSGHMGTTYLYSIGDYLFESPIAWYAPSNTYDMKPGLAQMNYMPPPLPMQSGCMRCHMSAVQPSAPGTINRYQGLPFLHGGITCESCHGDTTAHVATKGKAKAINPTTLGAELRDSICISCHLEGDVSVERSGHSALDFRPGESISTYLAFYVRTGAKLTDRAVSEVEQLSQSTCKRVSGDRMSCMSCHDPHYTPDASHRAAFFRARCLSCHSEPGFAQAHHPENQDCTSCHMPRAGARNVLHVAWTDHRIRKRVDPAGAAPEGDQSGDLAPVFTPGATKRDEAMANYKALLAGDRSSEEKAWELLNALRDNLGNDKAAWDALGNLSAERGEMRQAEQAFRRVLELDPHDLTALSNLGTLLAKEGKLHDGEALLREAFDRNQDVPGVAMNLARVQCMQKDGPAARKTLATALTYCPDDAEIRQLLTRMGDCGATDAK